MSLSLVLGRRERTDLSVGHLPYSRVSPIHKA
jgi:hypothetical protein